MVARGDLGVEIPIEEIPAAQKAMIRQSNCAAKPLSRQHRCLNPWCETSAYCAETTDVANAIYDGTDAVMLVQKAPPGNTRSSLCVCWSIARVTEDTLKGGHPLRFPEQVHDSVTLAVSEATVETAHKLGAVAVLTPTTSGFTARKIAMYRPDCPIYAATTDERVRRRLNLVRGVKSLMMKEVVGTDALYKELVRTTMESGLINMGDLVVLTAGIPTGVSGSTNLMKVHVVGEVLLKGRGIGGESVCGMLQRSDEDFEEGSILLMEEATEEIPPALERCSALITRAGCFPAKAVQRAVTMGVPVIMDVAFTEELISGKYFEVDPRKGLIFSATVKPREE